MSSGSPPDPCWWSNCLDDVLYVQAILNQLEHELKVDTAKIWGTGDSNGAMFLYQLIADPRTGKRFSAIAPVAGLPHNGFLFAPTNPSLRYLNIWGEKDTYIPAICPSKAARPDRSGPGCCGWFYSCISNTTRMFANLHNFAPGLAPHRLSSPLAGSAANCRGFNKVGADVSTALVVDCSWSGPHGWPRSTAESTAMTTSSRSAGARWPAEVILDFFLEGHAPSPPPSAAGCPMCGTYNCDGWISSDPERYTCAELKRDWNCNCCGCKSCPNVTAAGGEFC